jgi:hypothetical protein
VWAEIILELLNEQRHRHTAGRVLGAARVEKEY